MNLQEFSNNGLLLDYNYLKYNYERITEKYGHTPQDILNHLAIQDYQNNKMANFKFKLEQSSKIKFHTNSCFNLSFQRYAIYKQNSNFDQLLLSYNYIKLIFYNTDTYTTQIIDLFYEIYKILITIYAEYCDITGTKQELNDIIYKIYKSRLYEKFTIILIRYKSIFNNEREYISFLKEYIKNLKPPITENMFNILFTYTSILGDELSKEIDMLQRKYIQCHAHVTPFTHLCVHNEKYKNIGFISYEYRNHPVGYFMYNIINYINKNKYNIYIYSLCPPNEELDVLKNISNITWKNVHNFDSKSIANTIYNDNIDILFDQLQFTMNSKNDILCYKPSPCIISYLASPISSIYADYIILDEYLYDNQEYIKEKVLLLPNGIHCNHIQQYPINTIKTTHKIVHIGLTCSFYKLNDKMFHMINHILNENDIILIVRNREYMEGFVKNLFINKIDEHNRHKLNISFISDVKKFYEMYNNIDILLNTHPYGGCTTLYDALYMGTVCVSLKGHSIQERYAWSFLNLLNVPELCVDDEIQLYKKINYLCNNPNEIVKYQNIIKTNIDKHPMANPTLFIKDFEHLIEGL